MDDVRNFASLQREASDKKYMKRLHKIHEDLVRYQVENEALIPEETILADGSIRQDYPNGFVRIRKGTES